MIRAVLLALSLMVAGPAVPQEPKTLLQIIEDGHVTELVVYAAGFRDAYAIAQTRTALAENLTLARAAVTRAYNCAVAIDPHDLIMAGIQNFPEDYAGVALQKVLDATCWHVTG